MNIAVTLGLQSVPCNPDAMRSVMIISVFRANIMHLVKSMALWLSVRIEKLFNQLPIKMVFDLMLNNNRNTCYIVVISFYILYLECLYDV